MDTTGLTLYNLEAEEKTFLAAFSKTKVVYITHEFTQIQLFCRAMQILSLTHAHTMYFQSSELTDVSFY